MLIRHALSISAAKCITRVAALCAALGLAGCGGGKSESAVAAVATDRIDQSKVCETTSWRVATACATGQKIAFLPQSWGNKQLPVLFAALNCDLRYQVAMTEGAVVCIFYPVKVQAGEAASRPAPAASN